MANKEEMDLLMEKIDCYLEPMLIEYLQTRPGDALDFMTGWLRTKGVQIKKQKDAMPSKGGRDRSTPAVAAPVRKDEPVAPKPAAKEDKDDDSNTSSEDDSDDYYDEMPDRLKRKLEGKNTRQSVSAEAYGKYNQKGEFKPKVIPKTEEQKKKIEKRLQNSFMFAGLDDKDRKIVIDAMQEKNYKRDELVIAQGEAGSELFVVEAGTLDCFKRFPGQSADKYLKTYSPGESFGELALLYNAPRAATIRAKTDCALWMLDRETFNAIVKESAIKRRERYEQFLARVPLLQNMEPYERNKIADALVPMKFKPGEFVITQGEEGNTFYIIEEGNAVVLRRMNPKDDPIELQKCKAGDHFGERALLTNQVRAASVKAVTHLQVVTLDRDSFKRLIGPLQAMQGQ